MNTEKIGIMGGTFDPIHYGHLVVAEAARCAYQLDRVLFIPSGHPPHKSGQEVTKPSQRLTMTDLAISDNPFFFASDIETKREGYSYSVDTIKALKKLFPYAEFFFIIGADAFSEILSWYHPEELLNLCHFIAVTRPGYTFDQELIKIRSVMKDAENHLHLLEAPALTISSSDIRLRVKEGRSIKYLLPPTVENYIIEEGLYAANND